MVDQKSFNHQSWHCSLVFLLLEDNILHVLFYNFHFQKIIQKVCLLLENLDLLRNLNIDFVFLLIFLIDIYSSWLFFWSLILIVEAVLHYLELISYYWNINFCVSYCKSSCTCRVSRLTTMLKWNQFHN